MEKYEKYLHGVSAFLEFFLDIIVKLVIMLKKGWYLVRKLTDWIDMTLTVLTGL